MTPLHLRPNTWLRRITDRWELIKVINVHQDGQVDLLLLDGTRTHVPIEGENVGKPRLIDAFCCQGGASVGYANAGFDVVGIDIDPQPRYPFEFHKADALKFILEHHNEFDAFHASPPCQAHTNAQKIQGNEHPDFIPATRALFELIGKPWVIENVPGAPLHDPIVLCGPMFGLETYRHRLFESNVQLTAPAHQLHAVPTTKMGRSPRDGEFMHVVGNFSGVDRAREVMQMPWATRDGLREAIPPAYAEHVGRQLLAHINQKAIA